jgi:hypothetical protein
VAYSTLGEVAPTCNCPKCTVARKLEIEINTYERKCETVARYLTAKMTRPMLEQRVFEDLYDLFLDDEEVFSSYEEEYDNDPSRT